jgi:hypothetical protein
LSDLVKINLLDGLTENVFVSAGLASDFFSILEKNQHLDISRIHLVIHNGDLIPGIEVFSHWNRKFKEISAVNWLSELDNVRPIPIGLENWSYMRNGVPRDFLNQNHEERNIELLVSFSDNTNPNERSLAREISKKVPGVHFRHLVKRSKFVLSPPGNGPDCHRTWEAIYLGAVPVVKSEFWPFNGFALPVLVLQDWDQLAESLGSYAGMRKITTFELNRIFLERFISEV